MMSSAQSSPGSTLVAAQACIACKSKKRRCDKVLPACSLCARLGRECQYEAGGTRVEQSQPTSEDFAALHRKVEDLEALIARSSHSPTVSSERSARRGRSLETDVGSNGSQQAMLSPSPAASWVPDGFATMFFIDAPLFQYHDHRINKPFVQVPPDVVELLGDANELQQMMDDYFALIHPHLPMISKIRLFQHLASPTHEPGADLALLFLAVKLILSELSGSSSRTSLYYDTKDLFWRVEARQGYSIAMIQAQILIGLYELGHAIYPAAYTTIGQAARLAYAMGLHDRQASQMLPRAVTWTEEEERRRVFWAVILLDRYSTIGIPDRPFASQDPTIETLLPTDDAAWDSGQMLAAAPLSLSANHHITVAPFARTCQAAHVLGKVLRHVGDRNIPIEFRFDEAIQLENTVRALLGSIDVDMSGSTSQTAGLLFPATSFCLLALLTLFDRYCCTTRLIESAPETQLEMHKRSIEGIEEVSQKVVVFANQVHEYLEMHGRSRVSPLAIDALYQGAATFAWYYRECSDQVMMRKLREVEAVLRAVDRRWKAAGEAIRVAAEYLSGT